MGSEYVAIGTFFWTRLCTGLTFWLDGNVALATGAGLVRLCGVTRFWLVEISGALFAGPFEQPLVRRRKTPERTVNASSPAPNKVFSLDREGFPDAFFEGSCCVLFPK